MAAAVEALDEDVGDALPTAVDVYYDFRSPYAYFACHRIRQRLFMPPRNVTWRWQPVSIDILLNLQAGRDPWAAYVDPLPAPKRAHLIADVRRSATFYGAPLRPPRPSRPNSISALSIAARLGIEDHEIFRNATFNALWQEQRDIGNPDVLAECLAHTAKGPEVFAQAQSPDALKSLAERTSRAYANGIFGVPSFVWNGEVFFGNDRLEMLGWRLGAPCGGE